MPSPAPSRSESRSPRLSYRADLDGLRAVAVLAILGFHSTSRIPGGFVGVDIFFVISGFLITSLIQSGLANGSFTLADFYARRARRIFPALAVVLLVTALLGAAVLLPDEFLQLGRHMIGGVFFASNFVLWGETGYFDPAADEKPLLHLWSLGVEEQFYLVWPMLVLLLWKFRRSRGVGLAVIGGLGLASFAVGVRLLHAAPVAAYFAPWARGWELLIGALLAEWTRARVERTETSDAGPTRTASPTWIADGASIGGALAILAATFVLTKDSPFPGWWALLPTLGAALMIASGPQAVLNRLVLADRRMVYLGLISYPLYLWHWPLLTFARFLTAGDAAAVRSHVLIADALSLLAAAATYRWVERPLRAIAPVRSLPRVGAGLLAATIAGAALIAADGFPARTAVASNPFGDRSLEGLTPCAPVDPALAGTHRPAWCGVREPSGPDAAPGLVLIGDSHAGVLWPVLAENLAGRSAVYIGAGGCPFVRGVRAWFSNSPESAGDCPIVMDAAYARATREPATIILHARLALYANRSGFGVQDVEQKNPRKVFLTSATDSTAREAPAILAEALRSDLQALVAARHHVVIILQVPEMGFDVRACVRLRPYERWIERTLPACRVARAEVERRQRTSREIVAAVVTGADSPLITILDPLDLFCDANWCRPVRDGTSMYRDSDHLSLAGARYLWRALAPLGASAAEPATAGQARP